MHFIEEQKIKEKKLKPYNKMLYSDLIKNLKIIAAKQEKNKNDLIEETVLDSCELLLNYHARVRPIFSKIQTFLT